ncbi:RDD family protein [Hoyosella rhizosphaerae]|uniref:RDD family protein n=1 Tax=Hoyosella rhizosphaerae TaxID=1755582 RepID=UPI00166F59F1|nr:RDD family protein [Hoyosella rhizosphaerae]MBN4926670.1 RDD family protein [Hoyosella rhizosphaerae]
MSPIVSGEAVHLDLREATFASRAVAVFIDIIVQLMLLFTLVGILFAAAPDLDDALYSAIVILVVVLTMIALPVAVETLTRGRSLGKFAMGLRVVRDDGGPVRFRHSLIRGLAGFFLDFWVLGFFGAVAMIVSLLSPRHKRVGDYLAGTVVVRERLTRPPAGWQAQAQRQEWTRTLDLSRLTPDLVLTIRQFLSRANALRPEARHRIAQGLVQQLIGIAGIVPPADHPPELVLDSILAERRAREAARFSGVAPPTHIPDTPNTGPQSPFAPPK